MQAVLTSITAVSAPWGGKRGHKPQVLAPWKCNTFLFLLLTSMLRPCKAVLDLTLFQCSTRTGHPGRKKGERMVRVSPEE